MEEKRKAFFNLVSKMIRKNHSNTRIHLSKFKNQEILEMTLLIAKIGGRDAIFFLKYP